MKFEILGSSSSGNCSFLRAGSRRVLIDAGLSAKKIAEGLERIGESVADLDAVFITHEHEDHVLGLSALLRYAPDIQVFANAKTAVALKPRLKRPAQWQLFESGKTFAFGNLKVDPLPLPHDAADPVGYVFEWPACAQAVHRLAWVTDLGRVPEWLPQRLQTLDVLVLEANYDETLLAQDTRRPEYIKQRIRGPKGHLSNHQALELLTCMAPKVSTLYLAHLSKHCNHPELLESLTSSLLTESRSIHIVHP